jgi:hypothetical protein
MNGKKSKRWTAPSRGCAALGIVILCLLPVPLFAQIGASGITGTVTDPTGAFVHDAKITVRNEATGVGASTVSSTAGTYNIRNLIPGSYTVTGEVSGFKKSITEHVVTEVDKSSTVDIVLAVGSVTESVSVAAAEAVQLDTESSTVGQLITTKEIETLPLNGRNWISLNFLTPGAVTFHGTTAQESVTAAVYPQNVVLNGLRGGNNAYYIDGAFLPARETQVILVVPPLDALGEFRVQSGNFSSEFVGGAGGVVSATTKNGTNTLHGSVWEYLRNDALDGRNYFDTTKPPLKRNQFGTTLGGPILKNRTFFFGGYEGFRQRKGVTLVGDYPTAAQRNGNLSDFPSQIVNPLTGQPFPNNQIPVSPLSAKYLNDWIPLPNTSVPVGQGNLRIASPQPINYNTFVGRIDHTLSEKTNIFGRYYYTKANSSTPYFIPGFLRPVANIGNNAALQVTRTFTPTTVGQFRFSYNRTFQDESTDNSKGVNMLDELGIVPGALGFSNSPLDSLREPPSLGVTGYSGFGNSLFGRPRSFYGDSYFFDQLFFLNRGSHNIRMGGNVDREFHNFPEDILATGSWSYTGQFSKSALADFLLGYPRGISVISGLFHQDLWRWQDGIWFQDDWKVHPKLTLNLGLRWDYDERWATHSGTLANWDLSTPPIAKEQFPRANVAACPSGVCSPLSPFGDHLVDSPKLLWSPRVGFAYRLRENTVLRGGYGMYWQPLTTDPYVNMSLDPPFVASFGATYQLSDLPSFNRSNPLQNSSAAGISASGVKTNIDDGKVQEWNLSLEQSIGANLISVAYVGNKGTHLVGGGFSDQAPPGPGPLNPRRPFTNVSVGLAGSDGNSTYNSLQVRAERRFARGLSFIVSYAWEHAIDNSDGSYIESQSATFQQPNNLNAERSDAEFDVRNALTFSYIYELPFGRGHSLLGGVSGVADKLISGWQLQGITQMYSGAHQKTVTLAYDNLNDGGTGYPDRICDPNLGRGRSSAQKVAMFFNTACFAPPAGGTVGVPNYIFGNAPRHPLENPGIQNWNLALQKETALWERLRLQFTAEAFNLFNHPNFSPPNTAFGSPQFGRITAASDGRNVQAGVKFIF